MVQHPALTGYYARQLCNLFTSSKTIPRSLYSIPMLFNILMITRNHGFEKYFLKTGFWYRVWPLHRVKCKIHDDAKSSVFGFSHLAQYRGQNRSQKLVLRKYFSKPWFRVIISIINIVGIKYKDRGMVLDDVNKLHTPCRGISRKEWI